MPAFAGPEIPNSGLLLHLDAANSKNFGLTSVEVLVVAGGGAGGGGDVGGGGGAGGLLYTSSYSVSQGTPISITVGGGGVGVASSTADGGNGGNSIFGNLTAIGGGGGAGWGAGSGQSGGSGGSGVGGALGGSGTAGQGYSGGTGFGAPDYPQGGGGGAGGPGLNAVRTSATESKAGDGGPGLYFDQFASVAGSPAGWFAGGGGGGTEAGQNGNLSVPGSGGIGGGGAGGRQLGTPIVATSGTTNTGGGGGGNDPGAGGNGGSGIVIVRYPGPQRAVGGTVTRVNDYTIHTFTTVGTSTFTPTATSNVVGLVDFSKNNNFATAINGPTYNNENGGSIVFDGSNDYVSVPYTSTLTPTNQISFGAWAFLSNWNIDTDMRILSKTQTGGYQIGLNEGGLITVGYLGALLYAGGAYRIVRVLRTTISPGWHHIFCTFDGRYFRLYIDGVNQNTYDHGSNITISYSDNNHLVVGAEPGSGTNIDGSYFNGRISQVSVYNISLSANEVRQNFEAHRGRYGI